MLRTYLCLIAVILLAACSAPGNLPTAQPASPTIQATQSLASSYVNTFEVQAWVDNPNPERDERITVHGALIKNGVHLGGMAMKAVWPEEGQERGMPNCSVQVIYGAGVCAIEAAGYLPGKYVPVTVIFDYRGNRYTGETGFTPQ